MKDNMDAPPGHDTASASPTARNPPKAPTFYQPQPSSVSSPNVGASDKANPPSSVSPQILSNKNSSGESSDAGRWFESTNNAVQSNNNLENDPPFFLHNSSSSETPPDGNVQDSLYQRTTTMPYRPGDGHMNSESVEDFRSVIDDLTVANKKLKQKLKKYEKLHDSHLQDEKLFEVRFHGLPDHKKRELEETLRKFAADLDNKSEAGYPAVSSQPPPFDAQKTDASRFAESGYASMSGHNSNSARSNQPSNTASSNDRDNRRMTKSQYNQQQQSIQSYLHDIPQGLMPKSHTPMTDKSKKRLVVRRLEQIFAGKRSAPGSHPQPMQQEEVAQSAATADRRAKEAAGHRAKTEGNREARIMPVRADDEDITGQQEAPVQEALQKLRPNFRVSEQDFAGSGSPDQRPTRPLDLDPYRAQVPSDNMDYIRHLGFTPPDMMSGDSPEDDHGWIYLNLLINMAQLHTLNVTPEFVKQAVTEYSNTFELSHDGRKIRWKGEPDATLSSTGSSSEYQGNDSPYDPNGNSRSPSKYLKTGGSGSTDRSMNSERAKARLARKQKEKERNQFSYTPLFFHEEDSDYEQDSYGRDVGSSSQSPFQPQQTGDSSGLGSSNMQSASSKRRRNDGPIIFYSKAKFCTDLTGDSRGIASHAPDSYDNITSHPIGVSASNPRDGLRRQGSDNSERRGPLETTMMDIDSREGSQIFSSSEEMNFSPDALKDDNGTESPDAMEFEASGLGGVHPEDNFSIRVRRSQQQTSPAVTSTTHRKSQPYQKNIQNALNQRASPEAGASSPKQQHVIKEEILSASRRTLPNSTLPPASFLPFDSASSGDVDSDLESNVSSNPSTASSSENDGPVTALHMLNVSPMRRELSTASDDSADEEEEDDSSDDGSIDLLATARQMDPLSIIASEREYDAALADRLANDIPAGSSAATAGGGSGFNSPADAIVAALDEEGEQPRRGSRVKRQSTTSGSMSPRAKLKRSRTRESITTALQESSKRQKNQKRERRDL
ncbi:uncharacterized protein N0V89_010493 [Didymosphaeria variabile]|uniref:Frequency clock protein n=1 Tax=Didymosphaeria variabile TaxID=1932322 RepID=A0A9W8XD03_9PLEO|nr:uncharacterized protein N0V89_010493 [Didymosphaeria variabile]KAJ4346562.1 hypothetical protein N0V89_010493 [Didymosphaeria variabile]